MIKLAIKHHYIREENMPGYLNFIPDVNYQI